MKLFKRIYVQLFFFFIKKVLKFEFVLENVLKANKDQYTKLFRDKKNFKIKRKYSKECSKKKYRKTILKKF